jgi:hypothetical protein
MVKTAKHRKAMAGVLEELHLYKEKHGCFDCRNKFPHYILEFDHKPEFVKIDVVYRVLRNYGAEAAWAEVAKCDVLCANCHKMRTYQREHENDD